MRIYQSIYFPMRLWVGIGFSGNNDKPFAEIEIAKQTLTNKSYRWSLCRTGDSKECPLPSDIGKVDTLAEAIALAKTTIRHSLQHFNK